MKMAGENPVKLQNKTPTGSDSYIDITLTRGGGGKRFRGLQKRFELCMRQGLVYKSKNRFYFTALSLFKCIILERTRYGEI